MSREGLHEIQNLTAIAALAALGGRRYEPLREQQKAMKAIEQAVTGDWRNPDAKSRDIDRHPVEALRFWGLEPGMTILELQPGGGWWTEILAPYAQGEQGRVLCDGADLADPGLSEGARKGRADFEAKYSDAANYGKVNLVNWGAKAGPLPPEKFDFVLRHACSTAGWVGNTQDANLAKIFASLKPGGILAVEQHRGNPGAAAGEPGLRDRTGRDRCGDQGRVQIRRQVGDQRQSESTKDHPFGVWTLPPTRQSAEGDKPVDPVVRPHQV